MSDNLIHFDLELQKIKLSQVMKYDNWTAVLSIDSFSHYNTVISRFTVLLGGKQKCTVNRGKVNTCSIVEHDIGGTQRGTLYRGTR